MGVTAAPTIRKVGAAMAQIRGFLQAVLVRPVEYTDKKTKEKKTFENRSFNIDGVWLQVNDKSVTLPQKAVNGEGKREIQATFHRDQTSKVDTKTGEKKYFQNLICDGWKYIN